MRTEPFRSCGKCGRRVRYLWLVGRGFYCRGCMKKLGFRLVYPGQMLLRFQGILPSVGARSSG